MKDKIGVSSASFSWHDENVYGFLTPSRRSFRLNVEGDLFFTKNKINIIVGPTGSGKTSMLHALLGEMHFIALGPHSYFNLPRQGGVAYAAQESWVQNETIRVSRHRRWIVMLDFCRTIFCLVPNWMGNDMKQVKALLMKELDFDTLYKVLYQCGLLEDLRLFENGDNTEVRLSELDSKILTNLLLYS